MIRIDTTAGVSGTYPITFIQGATDAVCSLQGAPAGVSVDGQNRIFYPSSVAVGSYNMSLVCNGCEGSQDSVAVLLVVSA